MHDAVDPKAKIHSVNYSNANLAVLCVQGDSQGVYILSIIVTVKHSDNLIRLLKVPVWETLDSPEKLLYKLFWMAEKVHQDLLYKRKTYGKNQETHKTSKIRKQNTVFVY